MTPISASECGHRLVCVGVGGYRSKELANLHVKHIDFDELEVTAFCKAGVRHTAAISEETAEAIQEWMNARASILERINIKDHIFLFFGIRTGKQMTRHGVCGRVNKELGPRIKRPDLQVHDMRRMMCKTVIKNSAHDSVVMERGNSSSHNSFKRNERGIAPCDSRKYLIGGIRDETITKKAV